MCWLCERNRGKYEHCPDCGCLICFDVSGNDDALKRAVIAESGDLVCSSCAVNYEDQCGDDCRDDCWEAVDD